MPDANIPKFLSGEEPKIPPLPPVRERKCPYCAEAIKAEAVKCRYCGEMLVGPSNPLIQPKGEGLFLQLMNLGCALFLIAVVLVIILFIIVSFAQ